MSRDQILEEEEKEMKEEQLKPVQRLCNEIQLFDLCELGQCVFKRGRFCTKEELLARFEQISDKEDMTALVQEAGESMDEEDGYDPDCEDEFSEDELDVDENQEDDGWEDE